jgi:urease accessory protein UreE
MTNTVTSNLTSVQAELNHALYLEQVSLECVKKTERQLRKQRQLLAEAHARVLNLQLKKAALVKDDGDLIRVALPKA